MTSNAIHILVVVGLLRIVIVRGAIADDVGHVRSWGDLSGSEPGVWFHRTELKSGIPGIQQEFTASFPDVSFNELQL